MLVRIDERCADEREQAEIDELERLAKLLPTLDVVGLDWWWDPHCCSIPDTSSGTTRAR